MTEEKKPPKPKPVAKSTLTVYDDGKVIGDFYIWEENEVGRRKLWTVAGDDFFKYVSRAQPKTVRVLASCMNVQIVRAGLPEDSQGPWLRRKPDGSMELNDGHFADMAKPPGSASHGKRIAATQEVKAAKEIGLEGENLKAAVPDAQSSATSMELPTPIARSAPVPLGGAPGAK